RTERTHSDFVSYPPRDTGAPILGFPSLHGSSRASSRRYTGKQVLLDDRVDAPIAIDHLRDAEIDSDGHKRNRLVFGQSLGAHQETTHFAKRIPYREIDRGFLVDVLPRHTAALPEILPQ